MKNKAVLLAAGSLLWVSGCASILTEDTTPVNISTSNGKSATVMVDDETHQVPGVVYFKKDGEDKMVTTKPGSDCVSQTVAPRKVESEFWINIFAFGPLSTTTDMATDKMWGYEDTVEISCS